MLMTAHLDDYVLLSPCGCSKKGNVANQREHLILLLANMDVRNKSSQDYELVSILFIA